MTFLQQVGFWLQAGLWRVEEGGLASALWQSSTFCPTKTNSFPTQFLPNKFNFKVPQKLIFFWTKIGILAKCVALIMFWYKEIRGCIDIVVLVAAKLETVVTAL